MNGYALGIFVCETNSKMEFFTEHNTHKIHFCDAATLKFQEKYQALLFLSTARRMMCSVLYFSPIIPVCLPGRGLAMDPFVCSVKLKQRKLNVRGCQDPGAIVLIN